MSKKIVSFYHTNTPNHFDGFNIGVTHTHAFDFIAHDIRYALEDLNETIYDYTERVLTIATGITRFDFVTGDVAIDSTGTYVYSTGFGGHWMKL
jgi:hypothetical protein